MTSIQKDMKNRMPYTVPEGYFDSLDTRIRSRRKRSARRMTAVAASALLVLGIGGFMAGRSGYQQSDTSRDDAIVEFLMDSNAPLAYFDESL